MMSIAVWSSVLWLAAASLLTLSGTVDAISGVGYTAIPPPSHHDSSAAVSSWRGPTARVCGLEGFQFDTLRQPEYWSINVQNTISCLLPPGYVEAEVTSCTIYFSVCQALPSSKCGGVKNSSTCQEVTTNDTKTHYFSIGDFSENAAYSTLDDTKVGFVTLRQANIHSTLCNDTIGTFISWECDESKTWDPSVHDVTQYLKSEVPVVTDCVLSIDLLYNGACYIAPTLAPDTCKISPYDVMGLVKHDYWYATLPPDACPSEASTGCTIFFSFCQALPETIDPRCYGSAVCVVDSTADGGSTAYSLGKFSSYNKFVYNDETIGGGFHVDAENGSSCSSSGYGFRSRIILTCNSTVKWNDNQDLTDIIHVAYLRTLDPCEYNIEIPYEGACIPVGPTTDLTVDPDYYKILGLSIGFSFSVLSSFVLLVVLIIISCLLYKRCQALSYQKLHTEGDQPTKA